MELPLGLGVFLVNLGAAPIPARGVVAPEVAVLVTVATPGRADSSSADSSFIVAPKPLMTGSPGVVTWPPSSATMSRPSAGVEPACISTMYSEVAAGLRVRSARPQRTTKSAASVTATAKRSRKWIVIPFMSIPPLGPGGRRRAQVDAAEREFRVGRHAVEEALPVVAAERP